MKNVVQDLTSAGIDWQREKWQSGLGSKFIHQGEKNAAKYADEVIVLSKGVQDYFKEAEKEKELAVVQEELQREKQIAGSTEVLLTADNLQQYVKKIEVDRGKITYTEFLL